MSKARVKPAGWAYGEILTSAQMNTLDAYFPDLVDGAGGGTWAPSSAITIGGSGLTVTGAASLTSATVTAMTLIGEPTYSADQTVIRVQPLAPVSHANWSFDTTAMAWNQDVASSDIYFPLANIAGNSSLKSFGMFVSGTGTGGVLRLIKQDNAGTVTSLNNTSDVAGPAIRTLSVTVSPEQTIDWNGVGGIASLYAKLEGSSSIGHKVHHLWATYDVTATLY